MAVGRHVGRVSCVGRGRADGWGSLVRRPECGGLVRADRAGLNAGADGVRAADGSDQSRMILRVGRWFAILSLIPADGSGGRDGRPAQGSTPVGRRIGVCMLLITDPSCGGCTAATVPRLRARGRSASAWDALRLIGDGLVVALDLQTQVRPIQRCLRAGIEGTRLGRRRRAG